MAARLAEAAREAERLRRRTAAGVCPCCNRSFVQLARHMKTKHPDHVEKPPTPPRKRKTP